MTHRHMCSHIGSRTWPAAVGGRHCGRCVATQVGIGSNLGPVGRTTGTEVAGSGTHMSRWRTTIGARARRAVGSLLASALLCTSSPLAAATAVQPHRVLLLHSFRSALPINTGFTNGVTSGLAEDRSLSVEVDSESLDLSRFSDSRYLGMLIEILRLKYRDHPPDVIVPTFTPALSFMLKHGHEAFPGVPIVFCGADVEFVAGQSLPANVTGVTVKRDFAGTLELMLEVVPNLKHVAVVIGAGDMDRQWEADARRKLAPYMGRVQFNWLRGLPLDELDARLRALPANSAVLFVAAFVDRNGVALVPRAVATNVAGAAPVPVFGTWDTLIGSGILGGRMATIEDDAVTAGRMVARVLRGSPPGSIPVARGDRNVPIFDGRVLARWGLSENSLPPGSRVLFPQRSLWQEHRAGILSIVALISLQALLIVALLINRSRLHRTQHALRLEYDYRLEAENESRLLRGRLASFSKQSALGALATGIAHEINQPLAAIKNYVQAARRYVSGGSPDRDKVGELLGELEHEAGRAADIVDRIRGLISSGRLRPTRRPLRGLIEEVLRELEPELAARESRVSIETGSTLPDVMVDPIQVQVLLVNLLRNAIESSAPGAAPSITVSARPSEDGNVEVRVADQGIGVVDETGEIFEPLYSTKAGGMGVGLATCRTIVEAHGGRIWHSPNAPRGARFHFTLPIADRRSV